MSGLDSFNVAVAATRLQRDDALPSDWYMYFWLMGLAEQQGELKTVTQYVMRKGVETPNGFYSPLRMTPPTMRKTIKRLKKFGLAARDPGKIKSTTIKLRPQKWLIR